MSLQLVGVMLSAALVAALHYFGHRVASHSDTQKTGTEAGAPMPFWTLNSPW